MTTQRSITDIKSDLAIAKSNRALYRTIHNEGQSGYSDDSKIELLAAELIAAQKAASPLATRAGIEEARDWAKAQGWTANDLAIANNACLMRGYSLSDLQAAIKSL